MKEAHIGMTKNLSVRLTPELRASVLACAKQLGLKASDVIRLCVDAQVKEIEKTGKLMLNLRQQ